MQKMADWCNGYMRYLEVLDSPVLASAVMRKKICKILMFVAVDK